MKVCVCVHHVMPPYKLSCKINNLVMLRDLQIMDDFGAIRFAIVFALVGYLKSISQECHFWLDALYALVSTTSLQPPAWSEVARRLLACEWMDRLRFLVDSAYLVHHVNCVVRELQLDTNCTWFGLKVVTQFDAKCMQKELVRNLLDLSGDTWAKAVVRAAMQELYPSMTDAKSLRMTERIVSRLTTSSDAQILVDADALIVRIRAEVKPPSRWLSCLFCRRS